MTTDAGAAMDPRELRNALGSFATGVTVVTTTEADGRRAGLAVNSFASVSLEPPLILWSLAHTSSVYAVFAEAEHFVVNVLTAAQEELSNTFAAKAEDRFAGLEVTEGVGGVPLLPDCAAYFECRTEARHLGGDHTIIVGRVERFSYEPAPPLLFHGGRYARLAE